MLQVAARNSTLDYLRFFLAVLVVALHGRLFMDTNPIAAAFLLGGLARVCVPIFLIINGYYLFDVVDSKRFGQWIVRFALLYLIWMLFYSPMWIFDLSTKTFNSFPDILVQIIFGYHHLWYLSSALGASFLIYFAVKVFDRKVCVALSLILFGLGVVVQYVGKFHLLSMDLDIFLNRLEVHRNFLFLAFPFMYFGYWMKENLHSVRFGLIGLLWILLLGLVFTFSEALLAYSYGLGGVDNLLSVVLLAPAVFLLAQHFFVNSDTKKVAVVSSAVYLIHPFFHSLINIFLDVNSVVRFFITIFSSLIAAFFLISINKKLRFIL